MGISCGVLFCKIAVIGKVNVDGCRSASPMDWFEIRCLVIGIHYYRYFPACSKAMMKGPDIVDVGNRLCSFGFKIQANLEPWLLVEGLKQSVET